MTTYTPIFEQMCVSVVTEANRKVLYSELRSGARGSSGLPPFGGARVCRPSVRPTTAPVNARNTHTVEMIIFCRDVILKLK